MDVNGIAVSRPTVTYIAKKYIRERLNIPVRDDLVADYNSKNRLMFGMPELQRKVCNMSFKTGDCIGYCMLDYGHSTQHKYYCNVCLNYHESSTATLEICNSKWFGNQCEHFVHCILKTGHSGKHEYRCHICGVDQADDGRCNLLFKHKNCPGIYRCMHDSGHDLYHEYICRCGEVHRSISSLPLNDIIATVFYNDYYAGRPLSFTNIAEITNFSKSATRKAVHFLCDQGILDIFSGTDQQEVDTRKKFVTINKLALTEFILNEMSSPAEQSAEI